MDPRNVKSIQVYIAAQNTETGIYFLIGNQKQYIPTDRSWVTLKWGTKIAKDMFGSRAGYFTRLYLVFVGVADDGTKDIFFSVEVKNLRGLNNTTGYTEVYDKFSNSTDVPELEKIPTDFVLYQNYPNPFNPSTTIKFSIPTSPVPSPYQGEGLRERLVTLKVFDLLGREIATLVNEEKAPGNYEVNFDGTSAKGGLPSGVYFYTLHAGNYAETKKMLLMK